jgi:hypothetical protein
MVSDTVMQTTLLTVAEPLVWTVRGPALIVRVLQVGSFETLLRLQQRFSL